MELYFRAQIRERQIRVSGDWRAKFGGKSSVVSVSWDWDGEKLCVRNDRYGFLPVYYYCGFNEIIVSNSLAKILELTGRQEFDEEAFAVFLRLGYLIGDDTLFDSVKTLAPNSVLTWQNGETAISSPDYIVTRKNEMRRETAVIIYADLFEKAVAETLPDEDNFAVPISGGRDSRHILLALNQLNRRPAACPTIIHPPPRPNEDRKIAELLCRALKFPHVLIEQTKPRFDAECRKNILTDYGVFEHGWFLTLAEFAEDRWRTVYDGIAGDVLSAGLFLTENRLRLFAENKFAELAEEILGAEGYLPALLNERVRRKFSRRKAVRRLAREIAKHKNAPNPVGSFFFWNRTRRAVALSPFRLFDEKIGIITPYLNGELFNFLASLPAELFLDHEFHTETIAFAYPEFAGIPYERKDAPPVFDASGFNRFSRDIFRFSMTARNLKFTNRVFFAVRNLRSAIDQNYSRAAAEYGEQAVILLQLERMLKS